MTVVRRAFAVLGTLAFLAALAAPAHAQERKKLSKEETAHLGTLYAMVDAASSGTQPVPSDVKVTFHNYFVNAGSSIYIPFRLELQPAFSSASTPVAFYVRAVAKTAAAAAPAPAAAGGKAPAAKGPATFAFEDNAFYPASSDHVDRALGLTPGDYTVYFALGEPPAKDKKAAPPKATVLAVPLTVPDYSPAAGLTTSSIMLAKSVEAQTEALNGQQQLEQPFTISGLKITPTFVPSFSKTAEMLWLFHIYNEGLTAAGKPDLLVDNNFFKANEDKPFNHLAPSTFDASTPLPPDFSAASGLMAGSGVPLASFAPGECKMEIKVTDKAKSGTITRLVPFTVTP